jgi:hypothetical protein
MTPELNAILAMRRVEEVRRQAELAWLLPPRWTFRSRFPRRRKLTIEFPLRTDLRPDHRI